MSFVNLVCGYFKRIWNLSIFSYRRNQLAFPILVVFKSMKRASQFPIDYFSLAQACAQMGTNILHAGYLAIRCAPEYQLLPHAHNGERFTLLYFI
jgi:hypothetical protein